MSADPSIAHALREAGVKPALAGTRDLSGSCIHRVLELSLSDGSKLVAKVNDGGCLGLFKDEAEGLGALARTGTVAVPRVIGVSASHGRAVLLMTAIKRGRATDDAWRRFGRELAALHRDTAGTGRNGYGFETDNHLGSTPQPNGWCDDWVQFNARHRLGHQLGLAMQRRLLDAGEIGRIETVIERLDALVPQRPPASLLHGDLWSGNALASDDERGEPRIAVIDPACSYGDGWADIAMMKLFGGFPQSCFDAYAAACGEEPPTRIAVYQLYHVLNHVNLFGRSYAGQAMALAAALGA